MAGGGGGHDWGAVFDEGRDGDAREGMDAGEEVLKAEAEEPEFDEIQRRLGEKTPDGAVAPGLREPHDPTPPAPPPPGGPATPAQPEPSPLETWPDCDR